MILHHCVPVSVSKIQVREEIIHHIPITVKRQQSETGIRVLHLIIVVLMLELRILHPKGVVGYIVVSVVAHQAADARALAVEVADAEGIALLDETLTEGGVDERHHGGWIVDVTHGVEGEE